MVDSELGVVAMAPIYKCLYRKSDNRFISGGFYDAQPPMVAGPNDPVTGQPTQVPDMVNYGVAEFGDADQPDLKLHRYDAQTGGKRPATAQEIIDSKDADVLEQARHTSRQKDLATTIALMVRYKNVAAWDAMTNAQKKAAILAQADEWKALRVLIEKWL